MAKGRKNKGLLISFEGGEATGKSTQMRRLVERLKTEGINPIVTRQPGGTPIGVKIRELVLDPIWAPLNSRSELFLYLADRAQHLDTVVMPALKAGKTVISDRFADSSIVYQGICRGLGFDWVRKLNDFATGGVDPDLVFVLDLPEKERLKRFVNRGIAADRVENEKSAFHKKVRAGFLQLAKKFPKRIKILDATRSEAEIANEIWNLVEKKLK